MRRALLALVPLTLLPLACGPGEPPPKVETKPPVVSSAAPDAGAPAAPDRSAEIQKVAADAYAWGFPLVFMERTMRTMTNLAHIPLDTFSHKSKLATPADAEGLPNNDVLLSSAWVELKDEPVVLSMPDMGARWYALELIDMYGNPFASISRKTNPAGKPATYAILGPGDASPLPTGATGLKAPTNCVWLLMRTQVDGDADVAKLLTLLKQMTLRPKSGQAPAMPPAPEARPQDVKFAGAAFYDELGEAMKLYAAPSSQTDTLARFAKVGIGPGLTPSKTLSEKEVLALNDGQKAGEQQVSDRFDKLPQRKHGWDMDTKFGKWGDDYLARAAYVKRGFDINVADEIFSPISNTDDTDQILTGAHEYVLHFDKGQSPPASFWTLTLYSKQGTLVDNAKKRYSIGDRTAGLKRKPDGSLDLFIQAEAPKGNETNWLPAPKTDAFIVMLRLYQPKVDAINGAWDLPAVKKIK